MLARCDFDEQVIGVEPDERGVRPDLVVRLPGDKHLVVDAKAPMTALPRTRTPTASTTAERDRLLAAHATSLRAHVDALAAKAYWPAFDHDAGDGRLLRARRRRSSPPPWTPTPGCYEHAMARKVVLASPGTLLALLRTVGVHLAAGRLDRQRP